MKEKQNQIQRKELDAIMEQLEEGIREVFQGQAWKDYLNIAAKFHTYSCRNMLLIQMQCPDATMVAGYRSWEKNFGRYPVRGSKAIKIIAPAPRTVEKLEPVVDPETKLPVQGADGKTRMQKVKQTIPAYKVVNVFDVSQTDGKEIEGLELAKELSGDVPDFRDYVSALRYAAPVGVWFEKLPKQTKGYYDSGEKRIVIQKGMGQAQTLKTIIHEIAHGKLHDLDFGTETAHAPDRKTKEVQAESVAYTVCRHFGLDTSDYSFGYIASWSAGKELEELTGSMEIIRDTSAEIIDAVHIRLEAIRKERQCGRTPAVDVPAKDTHGHENTMEPPRSHARAR
jgi:hypothetical protein